MDMTVVSLRRYPVKSMAGEALASVELNARGLAGDRWFAVRNAAGRLATGKNTKRFVRRDGIFEFSARTVEDAADAGSDGTKSHVMVSRAGRDWRAGDAELDQLLVEVLDDDVRMVAETDVSHFDDGAVSLVGTATLKWCARELGADPDPRRLRVNLVVKTEVPFEEEAWVGDVRIGGVVLKPTARIERCRVIDLAQDGVGERTRWLKPLGDERDARVAIYLDVVTPGVLSVGDPLTLASTQPPSTSAP